MAHEASPPFRLQVLGPARVTSGELAGGRSLISQPRRLALLVYLALCRPRGLHSREVLLPLLWPELNQEDARHALRNALHAIRKALGPDVIITEGDSLVGLEPSRLQCDAIMLEDRLARGILMTLADLDVVMMEGFHVSGASEFERWLDTERRRFEEIVLSASWSLSESLDSRGDTDGSVAAARSACIRAPYDERSLRRLIELLDKRGDAAAAMREYETYARRLESELGVAPSPGVAKLAVDIRSRHANDAGSTPDRRRPAPTTDASTYIQYVRGTYLFLRAAHSGDPNDLQQCRALFESALERDPEFAHAYAGLSNYYAVAAARNLLRPFETTFHRAIELGNRALEMDSTLAIPHVHFGVKAMYLDQDWDAAGREFSTAVNNDPSYAEARRFLGIWYDVIGRPAEALSEMREAVRLEPQIAMFRNTLAAALMDRRDWVAAIAELERALLLDPAYTAARERLILCLEECGRHEEAIDERTRLPSGGSAGEFGRVYESEGREGYLRIAREELRLQVATLEARLASDPPANAADFFTPPELRLAVLSARLGDREAASRWEESACRRRQGLRPWFRSRPELLELNTGY